MVYINYISLLRYTILVGNPQNAKGVNRSFDGILKSIEYNLDVSKLKQITAKQAMGYFGTAKTSYGLFWNCENKLWVILEQQKQAMGYFGTAKTSYGLFWNSENKLWVILE